MIHCPYYDINVDYKRWNVDYPMLTVDAIIPVGARSIFMIWRKNYPIGWALPGGFVDYGESTEQAIMREVNEELNLELHPGYTKLLSVFSDPKRDPRRHNVSVVYTCEPVDITIVEAGDDAADWRVVDIDDLPNLIAFDHRMIIDIYRQQLKQAGTY